MTERTGMSRSPSDVLAVVLVSAVLVPLGFLWLDPLFYESVSKRFHTLNPLDDDLYERTQIVWNVIRLWAHWLGGVGIMATLVIVRPNGTREAALLLAVVLLAALSANVLQDLIGRQRPELDPSHLMFKPSLLLGSHGACFPSGEAATAMAVSVGLRRLVPRLAWCWYVPAVLVIASRLLPGMHYVSDVAAGALFGTLVAWFAYGPIAQLLGVGTPVPVEATAKAEVEA